MGINAGSYFLELSLVRQIVSKDMPGMVVLNEQAPRNLSTLVLCSFVLILLVSCACSVQASECNRLPNRGEMKAAIAEAEMRLRFIPNSSPLNITLIQNYTNITLLREHFTCLAVRGFERYSSAVIAVNYTSIARNGSIIAQFAVQCNANGSGYSLINTLNFRKNVDQSVFDLETRTDCAVCELFQLVVNRRREVNVQSGCLGEILACKI